jgi:DNA-binding CsgD family transcriptional regulator
MAIRGDALDLLTRSGRPAFATDPAERIVYWNPACEALLGIRASGALGRHCYEVVAGHDAFGNVYCYRNCPVAHQARRESDPAVRPFVLRIQDASGASRDFRVEMFAIPAVRPELATVVHVLTAVADESEGLEELVEAQSRSGGDRLWPLTVNALRKELLTSREKEVLLCLAEGRSTQDIARSLFRSPVTVRNHVQRILEKLGCHTKLEAVAFAYRNNLIGPPGTSPSSPARTPPRNRRGLPR